jgi:hypothetical protein
MRQELKDINLSLSKMIMSTVAARSGPTKKVPGLSYPSGIGSASPNPLGEGATLPDPLVHGLRLARATPPFYRKSM